ncbi:MAG TPA: glycosyltransferase family 39 protein, partial [Methylomirabilota bacterium]|nr:glycosyltransferase family 39 protein [Methylomirabilota bacterium]
LGPPPEPPSEMMAAAKPPLEVEHQPVGGEGSPEGARRGVWIAFGLILTLGALVRYAGLSYGLPHTYHSDEGRIVVRAVRFLSGDTDPRFFNWPSLYMYLLSGLYGLTFGVRESLTLFAADPGPFYLLGRTVTATLGTATIAMLYLLAAPLYGRVVAALAGLFLAVNLLHVHDSQYVTTDVPLTFLITLGLMAVLRYLRDGRSRQAVGAGLVAGLATSMKYPGGLLLLPLLVAHLLRLRAAPGGARTAVVTPGLVGAGLAGLAAFVAGTPYAVLTPRAFVHGVLDEVREIQSVQFGNEADLPGYLFHLLHSLPEAMGVPLLLLAAGGLGLLAWRRAPADLVLLAFPLPYFLVIGTWSSRFERYAVPLLPFLALLAALALVVLIPRLVRATWRAERRGYGWVGVAAAVVLLLAPELYRVGRFHVLLGRPDTRRVAADWIERELPPGLRIAMEPYSPAVQVTPGQARRLGRPGAALAEGAGFEVVRLDTYDLNQLVREQVAYVVLSGFVFERKARACGRYPTECDFYGDLERRGALVLDVKPAAVDLPLWVGDIYSPLTRLRERERPGPRIKVYRLPGQPAGEVLR